MNHNPNCDHYWLCRRGGRCPHCKAEFPGQHREPKFNTSRALADAQSPADFQKALEALLGRKP